MNWEQIAKELWQLLDDIDTAADMFHPNQTPYQRTVAAKASKRFEFLESDGYELFLPGTRPTPLALDGAIAHDNQQVLPADVLVGEGTLPEPPRQ